MSDGTEDFHEGVDSVKEALQGEGFTEIQLPPELLQGLLSALGYNVGNKVIVDTLEACKAADTGGPDDDPTLNFSEYVQDQIGSKDASIPHALADIVAEYLPPHPAAFLKDDVSPEVLNQSVTGAQAAKMIPELIDDAKVKASARNHYQASLVCFLAGYNYAQDQIAQSKKDRIEV